MDLVHIRVAAELDPPSLGRQVRLARNIANRAVLAVGRSQLKTLGLTYGQYLVMPTRPGVERKELEHLQSVLSQIVAAAVSVGVLDSKLDR
jgi:hypothetical protein